MIMLQGKNSARIKLPRKWYIEDGEWGMQIQNDIAAEFIYILILVRVLHVHMCVCSEHMLLNSEI